jgi:hypothetical protein
MASREPDRQAVCSESAAHCQQNITRAPGFTTVLPHEHSNSRACLTCPGMLLTDLTTT